MPNFLPRKDEALLGWSLNFDQRINAAPLDYGIPPERAAAFTQLRIAFAKALANVQPHVRTTVNCLEKDTARDAMKREIRMLKSLINAQAQTTNAQRVELGFKPKRTNKAAVIPPPTIKPSFVIVARDGWQIQVRVFEQGCIGKPPGVGGVIFMSFVGDQPPANSLEWAFDHQATTLTHTFEFDPALPVGTRVWLAAHWTSPTGKFGPGGVVSTLIAGASLVAA